MKAFVVDSMGFHQGLIKVKIGGVGVGPEIPKEAAGFGFGMQTCPHLSSRPTLKAWELAG